MQIFEVAVDFEYDNSMVFFNEAPNPDEAAANVAEYLEDDKVINIEASLVLEIPKGAIVVK